MVKRFVHIINAHAEKFNKSQLSYSKISKKITDKFELELLL